MDDSGASAAAALNNGAAHSCAGPGNDDRSRLLLVSGAVLSVTMTTMVVLVSAAVPVWALIAVWVISGYAMGLGLSTTSVLVLSLSRADERGRNSSALQLSDMLGGVIGTAGAGTVHALLWDRDDPTSTGVFVVIWAGLAVFAVLAAIAGHRGRSVEPGTEPGTEPGGTVSAMDAGRS